MIETEAFLLKERADGETDAMGVALIQVKKRPVYVRLSHVSGREFFEAATVGIKPELRARVFMGDYEDEERIEIENEVYRIYRVYFDERLEEMELYLTRRLHDEKND